MLMLMSSLYKVSLGLTPRVTAQCRQYSAAAPFLQTEQHRSNPARHWSKVQPVHM